MEPTGAPLARFSAVAHSFCPLRLRWRGQQQRARPQRSCRCGESFPFRFALATGAHSLYVTACIAECYWGTAARSHLCVHQAGHDERYTTAPLRAAPLSLCNGVQPLAPCLECSACPQVPLQKRRGRERDSCCRRVCPRSPLPPRTLMPVEDVVLYLGCKRPCWPCWPHFASSRLMGRELAALAAVLGG
jgi:hypothetical protein